MFSCLFLKNFFSFLFGGLVLDFRFDWYACTLPDGQQLAPVYRTFDFWGVGEPGKPMHGYDYCVDYFGAKILHGGYSGVFGAHVIIHGGDLCDRVVKDFRANFPVHRVSRADVKIDFRGEDIFSRIVKYAKKTKKEFGLQSHLEGDWLDGKRGRTFYLGSRKSTHYCRIYEKGHEMRQKNVNPDAPLDWVRVEFEVKPARQVKGDAASMTASQIAHSSKWTTFFCNLLGSESERSFSLSARRTKPEAVTSLEHMFKQYAATMSRALSEKWLTVDDLHAAIDECIEKGEFKEFPPHVFRPWYF